MVRLPTAKKQKKGRYNHRLWITVKWPVPNKMHCSSRNNELVQLTIPKCGGDGLKVIHNDHSGSLFSIVSSIQDFVKKDWKIPEHLVAHICYRIDGEEAEVEKLAMYLTFAGVSECSARNKVNPYRGSGMENRKRRRNCDPGDGASGSRQGQQRDLRRQFRYQLAMHDDTSCGVSGAALFAAGGSGYRRSGSKQKQEKQLRPGISPTMRISRRGRPAHFRGLTAQGRKRQFRYVSSLQIRITFCYVRMWDMTLAVSPSSQRYDGKRDEWGVATPPSLIGIDSGE
nr:unnamed protein product [Callosobruchus chinensis]